MKHSDKKQRQRRIDKSIKWVPGGFYRDTIGRLWCCVDMSNSHGLYYCLVRLRNRRGGRPEKMEINWFDENGNQYDGRIDPKIESGPFKHPEFAIFSGTKEATP